MSYVPEDLLRLDVWEINGWLRLLTIGISMRKPSEVVELLFWDLQGVHWFGNPRGFVCVFVFLCWTIVFIGLDKGTTQPALLKN